MRSRAVSTCAGLMALLSSLGAWAQPVEPPPATDIAPPVTPAEERVAPEPEPIPAPPPVVSPEPPAEPVPAEPAEEEDATAEAIAALEPFHWSGYVQAQFEVHEGSENELDAAGAPLNQDRFLVRRGRLKLEFRGIEHALFMMQIDATSTGVGLRDFVGTLTEPWTGWSLELAGGLFKNPFGFEVLQSSGDRVFPERSRLGRTFFPGERDVGVRLKGKMDFFNFQLALVNGNPIGERGFPGRDPNAHKDVVGRLGVDTDHFDIGLSGYVGTELVPGSAAVGSETTWLDANGDAAIDATEVTTTEAVEATGSQNVNRWRAGLDAELSLEVGGGKLELIAEGALGHRDVGDGVSTLAAYFAAVKHIGDHVGAAFRLDVFDPDLDAGDDRVLTIEPVLLVYPVSAVRISLAYALPLEQGESVDDSFLTARMQVKW